MMGVYWQLDDLSKPEAPKIKIKQDKVMVPLSVAVALSGMDPKAFLKVVDDLKKQAYSSNSDLASIGNANELSREEYLKKFGNPFKKSK